MAKGGGDMIVVVEYKRKGAKEARLYNRWGIVLDDGGGRHGVDKG